MKGGGAERVISLILDKLHDQYDIHLVLIDDAFDYEIPHTLKIKILSPLAKSNAFLNIIQIPILAFQLWDYNRNNKISTCISFLNRPNWINCFTKLWSSRNKVIISERTTPSVYYANLGFSGRLGKLLIKYLYPMADIIVPNSQGVKFDLEHTLSIKGNYNVIYNPVEIHEESTRVVPSQGSFTFIFVARFQFPKDHITLIRAFEKIARAHTADLILLGVGEKQKECKELVDELGINESVNFIGFDSNIHKFLSRSDCFVFSSQFEGFPNVILEAMAAGLPVIATECLSGPREIISPDSDFTQIWNSEIEYGEYGVLVPVGNISLLAHAMEKVLLNGEYRQLLSQKSLERAKQFNIEDFLKGIRSII